MSKMHGHYLILQIPSIKRGGIIYLFLILPLILVCSGLSFGQLVPERNHNHFAIPKPFSPEILVEIKQPLILINSQETKPGQLVMDEEKLEVLKEYDGPAATKMYGEKGEAGVVLARVNGNTALFRLEEVLDYFEVPAVKRTLTVLIDNRLVEPAFFLADVRKIDKIEVTKQDVTSPLRLSLNLDEEFLNIITKR